VTCRKLYETVQFQKVQTCELIYKSQYGLSCQCTNFIYIHNCVHVLWKDFSGGFTFSTCATV